MTSTASARSRQLVRQMTRSGGLVVEDLAGASGTQARLARAVLRAATPVLRAKASKRSVRSARLTSRSAAARVVDRGVSVSQASRTRLRLEEAWTTGSLCVTARLSGPPADLAGVLGLGLGGSGGQILPVETRVHVAGDTVLLSASLPRVVFSGGQRRTLHVLTSSGPVLVDVPGRDVLGHRWSAANYAESQWPGRLFLSPSHEITVAASSPGLDVPHAVRVGERIEFRWWLPRQTPDSRSAVRLVLRERDQVRETAGRRGSDGWWSAEILARSLADREYDWEVEVLLDGQGWVTCTCPIGDYPRLRAVVKARTTNLFIDGHQHVVQASYSATNSLIMRVRPRTETR